MLDLHNDYHDATYQERREAERQERLGRARAAALSTLTPIATVFGPVIAGAIASAVFAGLDAFSSDAQPVEHEDQPLEVATPTGTSDHIPPEHLAAATTLPPVAEEPQADQAPTAVGAEEAETEGATSPEPVSAELPPVEASSLEAPPTEPLAAPVEAAPVVETPTSFGQTA